MNKLFLTLFLCIASHVAVAQEIVIAPKQDIKYNQDSECYNIAKGYYKRCGAQISNFYGVASCVRSGDSKDSVAILVPFYTYPGWECFPDSVENPLLVILDMQTNAVRIYEKALLLNDGFGPLQSLSQTENGFMIEINYSGNNGFVADIHVVDNKIDSICMESWGDCQYTKTYRFNNLHLDDFDARMIDSLRVKTDYEFMNPGKIDCEKTFMDFSALPISAEKNLPDIDTFYFEKKCHEKFLELSCIIDRYGYKYTIETQIYSREGGEYRQVCRFFRDSDRNHDYLYGVPGNGTLLKDILFDAYDKNELLLTENTDIQTEEKTKKYYNEILCSNRNNPKILKMLAVAFILDKEFITDDNVELVYELANCLYENKCYQYSIQVFLKINATMHYPNDTKTCLGLGDNYWMIGNVSLAKTYYESYVLLMNSLGKTNEIAQRVLKRIQ